MIILNTTFHIHDAIASAVIDWIKRAYQESALQAGAKHPVLTRVIGSEDDNYASYALQVTFDTMGDAERWNNGVANSLRRILSNRYGDKALTFHTFLEVL